MAKLESVAFLVVVSLGGCGAGGGADITTATTPITGVVDGYASRISYVPGEHASFYLNANARKKGALAVYDVLGRPVDTVDCTIEPQQITNPDPWQNGFGYRPTVSYSIPVSMQSGLYLLDGKVPFLVKGARQADVVILYPSNTDAAYNAQGGKSLYYPPDEGRATIVSYQRPASPVVSPYCEPFLKWLLRGQFTGRVRYICDRDLDDAEQLASAKVLVVIGHSEYWTRTARLNFDRFVDGGGHALILSGNTMWWQVRYSDDGTQMICYKSSKLDPVESPLMKTVNWTDPSLGLPPIKSIGADFDHGGYGRGPDRGWDGFKVVDPESPVFAGTGLRRGDVISLASHEYDGTLLLGFDDNGYPLVDRQRLGFASFQLLGFDFGSRGGEETVGTWFVMRKSASSGIIINAASTDWCSNSGIAGPDGSRIQTIIANMLNVLLGT